MKKQNEPHAAPDRKGKPFNKNEDNYIKENFLLKPYRVIAKELGRSKFGIQNRCIKLGLKLPKEIKIARNNYFSKGHEPANKGKKQVEFMTPEAIEKTKATRFKKGQKPHNTLPGIFIVTIRTDYKRGTKAKYIKLGDMKYQELHRYNWEKKYGKVPKGMCIAFKDRNSLNCNIENLELITREENMRRNTINRYPMEIKTSIRTLSKLNKKIKNYAQKQNL